jgi:hypothetical protein
MNNLILYTTDNARSQIKLREKDQTVWLTPCEMAQLFEVSTDNVGLHLKKIVADEKLKPESVTEQSSATASDGKNLITKLYNLDAILAVGYRMLSPRTEATAAERILARANGAIYHSSLLHWKGNTVRQAAQRDEADIKALETTIPRRPKP